MLIPKSQGVCLTAIPGMEELLKTKILSLIRTASRRMYTLRILRPIIMSDDELRVRDLFWIYFLSILEYASPLFVHLLGSISSHSWIGYKDELFALCVK